MGICLFWQPAIVLIIILLLLFVSSLANKFCSVLYNMQLLYIQFRPRLPPPLLYNSFVLDSWLLSVLAVFLMLRHYNIFVR